MNICLYVINLDRSVDRWGALSHQASIFGLPTMRVSGVDGTKTSPDQRIDCDMPAFECNNGRTMLSGEYGCYRSHLKALSVFLESNEPFGVIVEDDLELAADLLVRARAAIEAVPDADIVKLFNHRVVGFRRVATSVAGDEIGRAAHGPLGSSACYIVTRRGAERLIQGIRIMEYPLDIAIERGWANGAQIYTTRWDVARPRREGSTIGTRDVYRTVKFPWWKRFRTYGTRIVEATRRLGYWISADVPRH